jgi:hypothetical protein
MSTDAGGGVTVDAPERGLGHEQGVLASVTDVAAAAVVVVVVRLAVT